MVWNRYKVFFLKICNSNFKLSEVVFVLFKIEYSCRSYIFLYVSEYLENSKEWIGNSKYFWGVGLGMWSRKDEFVCKL